MQAEPTASGPSPRRTVARLKTRPEFVRASGHGRKAAMIGLVLQSYRRHDGPSETRVGFTVTKKVGNAVVRNRARRRLREAARLVFRDDALSGVALASLDLVLIGRAGTIRRPFLDLRRDLVAALERTGATGRRETIS